MHNDVGKRAMTGTVNALPAALLLLLWPARVSASGDSKYVQTVGKPNRRSPSVGPITLMSFSRGISASSASPLCAMLYNSEKVVADECLSCAHLLMASAERTSMPRGSLGRLDHSCQPCIVGMDPWKEGLGPQPSSQKSSRCLLVLGTNSFLLVPLMRRSPSRGAMLKSTQRRRSRLEAQTGPAAILIGRPFNSFDATSFGWSSIMTFSTMCLTGTDVPTSCWIRSSIRTSSQNDRLSLCCAVFP